MQRGMGEVDTSLSQRYKMKDTYFMCIHTDMTKVFNNKLS